MAGYGRCLTKKAYPALKEEPQEVVAPTKKDTGGYKMKQPTGQCAQALEETIRELVEPMKAEVQAIHEHFDAMRASGTLVLALADAQQYLTVAQETADRIQKLTPSPGNLMDSRQVLYGLQSKFWRYLNKAVSMVSVTG